MLTFSKEIRGSIGLLVLEYVAKSHHRDICSLSREPATRRGRGSYTFWKLSGPANRRRSGMPVVPCADIWL